jgi:hypothetical protein
MLKGALKEWSDKTEWVQETAQPLELGMHRADVLKQRIERLKASIALDKKAENARELGLSYDDVLQPVPPVPDGPYSAPIKHLWPVAPKPWVGLTDEELKDLMAIYSGVVLYRAIESKLKELNT